MRDIYHDELDAIGSSLLSMTNKVGLAMDRATNALLDGDLASAEKVVKDDTVVDALRADLEQRTFTLMAQQQPVAGELRLLITTLHLAADLERMGDLALHIAKVARDALPGDRRSHRAARRHLANGCRCAVAGGRRSARSSTAATWALAQAIEAEDDSMDALHRKLFTLLLSPNWAHGTEAAIDMTLIGRVITSATPITRSRWPAGWSSSSPARCRNRPRPPRSPAEASGQPAPGQGGSLLVHQLTGPVHRLLWLVDQVGEQVGIVEAGARHLLAGQRAAPGHHHDRNPVPGGRRSHPDRGFAGQRLLVERTLAGDDDVGLGQHRVEADQLEQQSDAGSNRSADRQRTESDTTGCPGSRHRRVVPAGRGSGHGGPVGQRCLQLGYIHCIGAFLRAVYRRGAARTEQRVVDVARDDQLVCPCHYSTFDPATGGTVTFGPAGRDLPMLPIYADARGLPPRAQTRSTGRSARRGGASGSSRSTRVADERATPLTRRAIRFVDQRSGSVPFLRKAMRYVFPDHWSFLLGEVALYAFMVLVATGIYLTFFFVDSTKEIVYHGHYAPLYGQKMSEAYASVLHISLGVQAGLLIRQTHHWAANVFIAAIVLHLLRVFFTGAYRKPRELTYVIGVTMLTLALLEAYIGYSLVDDLMSGMGLVIGYSVGLSIPFVGQSLMNWLFGGMFPGSAHLWPRMYIAHVLIFPILIGLLLGAHLVLVMLKHHTQFKRTRAETEHAIKGVPAWPGQAPRSIGLALGDRGRPLPPRRPRARSTPSGSGGRTTRTSRRTARSRTGTSAG